MRMSFGLDLDVHVFGFRQHSDRHGRSVNAALRLGLGHALHAMHAALVLHARIHAVAFDDGDDFLQSADARLRRREHFHLPALGFGVAVVHAEDLRREQRGFVAAGSGADFQDDVLLVIRILGQQQHLQLFFDGANALFQAIELLLRIGAHLGIALVLEHRLALANAARQVLVLAILLHDRLQLAVRLRGLLIARRVGDDLRRSQRLCQLFVFRFDLF